MIGPAGSHDYQMELSDGIIKVWRLTPPTFYVQIIIQPDLPEPAVTFRGTWTHTNHDRMHWYFRALGFYLNQIKTTPK